MTLIYILHILACIFIVLFVLLQSGKGTDAGAMLGGANTQSVFGGAGPATFLAKGTGIAAAIFFITSLSLTVVESKKRESVVDKLDAGTELSTKSEPGAANEISGPTEVTEAASSAVTTVTLPAAATSKK